MSDGMFETYGEKKFHLRIREVPIPLLLRRFHFMERSVILNYLWDKCKRGRMAACKGDICRGAHTPGMEVYSPAITSHPPRLLRVHVKLIESKDSFSPCIKRFESMLLTILENTFRDL